MKKKARKPTPNLRYYVTISKGKAPALREYMTARGIERPTTAAAALICEGLNRFQRENPKLTGLDE